MNGFFVYLYALAVLFLGYVLAFTLTGARLLVVYNHKSHGSLTIRLGALVFSAGALCYFGLETVSFAEVRSESPCYKPTLGANVALALAFVALQTYVIFVYPRLNLGISPAIDRCAKRLSLFPPLCLRKFCSQFPFSRFGLMHLVATNIILWIRTLLKESLHEISESEEEAHEGELGEGGAGRTEATATPRSGTEHLFNRPAHDHGNCSFMIDRIRQYEHKQVQDKGREEGRTELKGGGYYYMYHIIRRRSASSTTTTFSATPSSAAPPTSTRSSSSSPSSAPAWPSSCGDTSGGGTVCPSIGRPHLHYPKICFSFLPAVPVPSKTCPSRCSDRTRGSSYARETAATPSR